MGAYAIKRIGYALLTIFFISIITFTLMNLIPGGPFLSEKNIPPETVKALNVKYGLDKPLPQQYLNYMGKLITGDLGDSLKQKGRSADDIIFTAFPISAKLGGISILVAVILGVFMGSVSALNRGRFWDRLLMVVSTLGIAVPSFVMAAFLMLVFGVKLRWLPTMGLHSVTAFIMPCATLAFYPMSYITRLMRSGMLDALDQDYIRTAKSKGVGKSLLLFKHALRNAVLPVITYLGPMIAYTVTGSFVVETVFNIPGLGREFIQCITARDYPLVMSTTIFLAVLIVLMNLVVDLSYKLIDPRITLQ
ncbi:Oligopeptide transport system permease protein OppB [Caprobacter fermentans]|uniref:ABC transporter permease n=1 Tax=Caproicibacter fermentans TaxID=2576756 RepID=A0A6N8I155_9FIRM|nr:ABC transporter permease [Caproicibacter fermentans]MVB11480.1 Oligopeptide transport system permease protein OppB [Caproicibacter fermentans]QNK40997.1 ABC transporter permease [Caproicibacter fermentans]